MPSLCTLPNIISLSRLVAVLALILAAGLGYPQLCLVLFGYALISDVADGKLARALGQVSARGALLDSFADCIGYLTAPPTALFLFPWLRERETLSFAVIFLAFAAPVAYGFAKYRSLTSYHTTGARVAGALLSSTFIVLLITHVSWPFHIATALLLLSAIEEMAITHRLDTWRADIPSFRHLLRETAATRGRIYSADVG